MKSYNPKGPKSIAKSVKGIRALHEGDTCNFGAVKDQISHLVIVSIGFTMFLIITVILYMLICIKTYKKSKKFEFVTKKESLA